GSSCWRSNWRQGADRGGNGGHCPADPPMVNSLALAPKVGKRAGRTAWKGDSARRGSPLPGPPTEGVSSHPMTAEPCVLPADDLCYPALHEFEPRRPPDARNPGGC